MFFGLPTPLTIAWTSTTTGLACGGATTVQTVVEVHSTPVAAIPANLIVVAEPSAKPLPVIVTLVPPAIGPLLGLTPVTVGAWYLNRSALEMGLVPPGTVTVTSTS